MGTFYIYRIRSETCHQLKQLLYLSAGQRHHTINSPFGVEPCCQFFTWENSHSPRAPPPFDFEPISLQNVSTSPFIDLLLDVLFKTPQECAKGSNSSSSKTLLPPFWTTNQLSSLADDLERQAMMHCAEFFRLRGRVFAFIEESCLIQYAGQDHVAMIEVSLSQITFRQLIRIMSPTSHLLCRYSRK